MRRDQVCRLSAVIASVDTLGMDGDPKCTVTPRGRSLGRRGVSAVTEETVPFRSPGSTGESDCKRDEERGKP